jgi:hypothetical protein
MHRGGSVNSGTTTGLGSEGGATLRSEDAAGAGCQAPGGDGPNDTLAARGGRAPGRPCMGGIREKLEGFETCCANGLRARDLGVG